jgi:hypothetical protein
MASAASGSSSNAKRFGPQQFWQFVVLPIVVIVFGGLISQSALDGNWLRAVAYLLVVILLYPGWLIVNVIRDRSSYYRYFLVHRLWAVLLASTGLGFLAYRLYDYFERLLPELSKPSSPHTNSLFFVSSGADFLLYLFGTALFAALTVWAVVRLRSLSFQQPLPESEAELSVAYLGHRDNVPPGIPDRGNHIFRLTFTVKDFVDALSIFFVAVERLRPGSDHAMNVVWTSEKLSPARPLGLSADGRGDTRLYSASRVGRCVVRDGDELQICVFAEQDEHDPWFGRDARFRAVVYLRGGGLLKNECTVTGAEVLPTATAAGASS